MILADGLTLAGVDDAPGALVRSIADTLPDGVLAIDGSRALVFVNQRAEQILRSPVSTALGAPIRESVPLWDAEGRMWWDVANPWKALPSVDRKSVV